MKPCVKIKSGKENSIKRFHPWIFSGAIASISELLHEGQLVEVVDQNEKRLGWGHFSEGSISVRMFMFGTEDFSSAIWENKIRTAYQRRVNSGVISVETTLFRLIHAEGDGMPGVIIDVYGSTAVMQFHGAGMYAHREEIARAIVSVCGNFIQAVYNKSKEKLKSVESEDGYIIGSAINNVALENGIRFVIDWINGQKTGFFIDQRDNRELLGKLSKGKKVLNTFCYTGGFSLYALKNGASLVHSLDSSAGALRLTEENISANNFNQEKHACIQADAVQYLKNIETDYDIIILDPPAFAKHLSSRHKAIQGYRKINEAAIRQIKSGGLLFTFSCSQVVDKEQFRSLILASAIAVGREVRVLYQLHQGADHPISIFHSEGEYLKGLVLEVI
jgi:23S rRNA (cytosine1962-C5)-methyltransferase